MAIGSRMNASRFDFLAAGLSRPRGAKNGRSSHTRSNGPAEEKFAAKSMCLQNWLTERVMEWARFGLTPTVEVPQIGKPYGLYGANFNLGIRAESYSQYAAEALVDYGSL